MAKKLSPVVVSLTMEEAERLGIVACEHCGWPRNNHFQWKPMPCAHDNTCPGFKVRFRVGVPVDPPTQPNSDSKKVTP